MTGGEKGEGRGNVARCDDASRGRGTDDTDTLCVAHVCLVMARDAWPARCSVW
jgi:hypothetical protein